MAVDLSQQIYCSTSSYPWSANHDAGSLSDIIAAFPKQHESLTLSSKFLSFDILIWAVIFCAFLFMTSNNTRSQMHDASKRAELDCGKMVYAYDCSAKKSNATNEQQHVDANSSLSSASSESSFFDSLAASAASMMSW